MPPVDRTDTSQPAGQGDCEEKSVNKHVCQRTYDYVILAITLEGKKDVISLPIGENESSKYWLGVLNELKNRRAKDVFSVATENRSAKMHSQRKSCQNGANRGKTWHLRDKNYECKK